jgi:hypothetical protein
MPSEPWTTKTVVPPSELVVTTSSAASVGFHDWSLWRRYSWTTPEGSCSTRLLSPITALE